VVAQNGLAEVYKAQGRYTDAEEAYKDVINGWPNNVVAQNGLANLLRQQGRYEQALKYRTKPVQLLTQQDHRNMRLYSLILLGMGQLEEAHQLLTTHSATAATQQRHYYQRLLLMVELKRNKLETIDRYIDEETTHLEDKVIYLHAYAAKRQKQKARQLWQSLNKQKSQMSPYMKKTFELVETTYCRIDNLKKCKPSAQDLTRLYAAEANMLAEAA
ncbi:MAG: tetratricopeptide repeat protein, partial [bacterium]